MQIRISIVTLFVTLVVGGCSHFKGPPETLDPSGPVNKSGGTDQFQLFSVAYAHAYQVAENPPSPQQRAAAEQAANLSKADAAQAAADRAAYDLVVATRISNKKAADAKEANTKATALVLDPAEIAYKNMAKAGFGVVNTNCQDYFRSLGNEQRYFTLGTDLATAAGVVATAVTAVLSSGSSAVPILAVATAVGPAAVKGLTSVQKDYLFGADNIDDTRTLVINALDKHATDTLNAPTPWTFHAAVEAIHNNQDICRPAHILSLTKSAVKNAPLESVNSSGGSADMSSSTPASASSPADKGSQKPTGVRIMRLQ